MTPGRDIYAYTKVIGEQLGELYHRAYGSDKAQAVLGWQPRYDFARFLQDLSEGTADYGHENRYPVPNAPAPWRP